MHQNRSQRRKLCRDTTAENFRMTNDMVNLRRDALKCTLTRFSDVEIVALVLVREYREVHVSSEVIFHVIYASRRCGAYR